MAFRGYISLALFGVLFLALDLVQRTVITAMVRLRPSSRERVFSAWVGWMARLAVSTTCRVGGARIDNRVRIAAEPGTLVVMNHQSLLDIPVLFDSIRGGYPKVVTRKRYSRKIPLISYMLRMTEQPFVDPGKDIVRQMERLRRVAATTMHPMAIFPEGSRTRDGEIRPFKTAGLEAILSVRRWKVYVVVVDGLWQCAKLVDYIHTISSVRARAEMIGPFDSPGEDEDKSAFIARMRDVMCARLREMREGLETRAAG